MSNSEQALAAASGALVLATASSILAGPETCLRALKRAKKIGVLGGACTGTAATVNGALEPHTDLKDTIEGGAVYALLGASASVLVSYTAEVTICALFKK